MGLKLVTAPSGYPVSLDEAKAHLRYDDDDQDDLITALIAAATGYAEKFLGRALLDQTWDFYADAFPTSKLEIPLPPLIEVVGVFYSDSAGDEQELAVSGYEVDDASSPARVVLPSSGSWPVAKVMTNAVRIRFRAGYLKVNSPAEEDVPFEIKAAILLTIGSLFEHRETVVVGQTVFHLPFGAEQLLRQHRVEKSMA